MRNEQATIQKLKKKKFCEFPFKGVYTALATPFLPCGSCGKNEKEKVAENKIDYDALEKIVRAQVAAKIDGLVLFGSTGEHFSLTENEKKNLFFTVKEITSNKLPLVCCAGTPSTRATLNDALLFKSYGANGLLLLTPFYYKCADNGVIAHFSLIAETAKLPVIIYNVPSRTGYDLYKKPNVLKALSQTKYVVGIKEAETDEITMSDFIRHSVLPVVSGCDENNFSAYQAGAAGAISVASNVFPKKIKEIYDLYSACDEAEASKKERLLKPLYKALTLQGNPVPLKFMLEKVYGCFGALRLPLTEATDENKKKIAKVLSELSTKN
ncbi:MAG: 4-hydroxy-tetrahydrodipicolinate synthase [Candidatus Borkfalkiaceae bacterium]|nr:4-hydroxy-tetrahydrodipicolinate synthase [Christensenellaceae bacterium]